MRIGFSTGSIAFGDFRRGLIIAKSGRTNAIELSALREDELEPLLQSLDALQNELGSFQYISFHAPSRRDRLSESELVEKLKRVAMRGWPVIVHPDVICDFALWRELGDAVCIENMDKRKPVGRTAAQLQQIFTHLPQATFCFDIGHAWQVDSTMQEAEAFLRAFGNRLRQVHMSYVNSTCGHERLNYESVEAYKKVAHWLDRSIPIILETPVQPNEVAAELEMATRVFEKSEYTPTKCAREIVMQR